MNVALAALHASSRPAATERCRYWQPMPRLPYLLLVGRISRFALFFSAYLLDGFR
jgi:hypothetical protein